MARRKRNESPERQALREMMAGYLKDNPVRDGKDVNSIMREMMSVILEGTLDGELDDTLGYSKYDYKNKDTVNSRNGYSKKTMHTSYGDMDLDIPRDRNGEYEPQVIKKYQNTLEEITIRANEKEILLNIKIKDEKIIPYIKNQYKDSTYNINLINKKETINISGKDYLIYNLLGKKFKISMKDFYQEREKC